jgi:ferredoxin
MTHRILPSCTGCLACVRSCPTGAIQGDRAEPAVIDPARCIDCGACGLVCMDEAVTDPSGCLCVAGRAPEQPRAWVDLGKCVGCGGCASACLFDALVPTVVPLPAGPRRVPVVARGCVACGLCELACSLAAVKVLRPGDPALVSLRARNHALLRPTGTV